MRSLITTIRTTIALAAFMVIFANTASAQVTVVATAATMGPTVYATVDAAFQAINAGTHQGIIGIGISANTTEAGPCVLNSSGAGSALYTAITLSPTVDGVTISGPTTTGRGLIELKGTDNVTIDGDNPNTGGINRNLTITNTAANTTTFTSVVRICNAATVVTSSDNIIIRNLVLNGSATGRNGAGITSTTGSENTTFGIYCGGNGGATDIDAPTPLTNVTTNTAPSGTTINALLINNNTIVACARGIVFNGAATSVSTGVTITANVLGTAGAMVGLPPYTTPATTVYTKGVWVAGTNAITVSGNTLQNIFSYVATGMAGIELNNAIGTGTITVSGNTINGMCQNSTAAQVVKAILLLNAGAPYTVSSNTISNIKAIQSGISSTTTTVAIEVSTAAVSGTVELNTITTVISYNPGTTGAFGINVIGSSVNVTIRNNFISDINNCMTGGFSFDPLYGAIGIRLAAGSNHKVYFNTVQMFGVLNGTVNTDLFSACLTVTSTAQTGLDIRNNVLSNVMTGGSANSRHVSIFLPSGGSAANNVTINNNVYYSGTGAADAGIAQVGTTYAAGNYTAANFNPAITTPATNFRSYSSTLSAAGTNDNASFASSAAGPFISTTNLHINNVAGNATDIDGRGTPIAGITLDIDGNTRNVTTPDAGADEFSLPGCVGAVGGTISPSSVNACQGQTVLMTSVGATSGLGITYQWMVGPTSGGPYSNVVGGSGATTTAYTTAALAPGTYYYVLQVTCSSGPVSGLSNQLTVVVNALPTIGLSPASALYCNPGPGIALTGSGASTYAWSPSAGLSATTGSNVTATPVTSVTYTVVGTDANGCTGSATTAITSAPAITGAAAISTSSAVCVGGTVDLSSSANPSPSTLLTENFNSGAPTWTRVNNSTGGTPANAAWTNRPDGYVYAAGTPYHSNDNSQFVQSNSDAQGSGSITNTLLQSPSFSTVGYSALSVSFYQYYRDIADPGDSAVIEASTNAVNWTICGAYTANTGSEAVFSAANINLPPAFDNQATVYIRFRYIGTWDWYWSIDNVSVNGSSTSVYTYAWTSTPVGFTSTSQNPTGVGPTANTTYSVTISNPAGCTGGATVAVNINALPTITASVTPSAVCLGDAATFNGGGATTYTWTGGVTDNTPFTPSITDTYTVTGTDINGCSGTNTVTLTVHPLPAMNPITGSSMVCAGDSTLLTGTGGGTSQWYLNGVAIPGATSSTYYADQAGVYNMTKTNLNGCTDSSAIGITVTVNPLPTVVANVTSTTVCSGTPVTFTGSGATSYTWTGGVTNAIPFTPPSTDTYTVTGTDGNGCSNTSTVTVTVNPTPTVAANSTASAVCAGSPVTLSGSGAATYVWTGGVTDAVAFTPVITDTYTVTGTDANGCTASDVTTVTVNALPTVTASVTDSLVCAGDSVTFMGGGATTYTWNNGVTDMMPYSVMASDTFMVTGTDANGCMNTASVMVGVNALPNVTLSLPLDTACLLLGPVTLGGESPAGGTWSGPGVTGNSFNPGAAGNGMHGIMYTYMDSVTGCSATAIDSMLVDICNDVDGMNNATIQLYPNPNNGEFTLIPAGTGVVDVMIYSATGQLVQAQKANAGQVNPIRIDASGMYSIVIVDQNGMRTTQRVIVNR